MYIAGLAAVVLTVLGVVCRVCNKSFKDRDHDTTSVTVAVSGCQRHCSWLWGRYKPVNARQWVLWWIYEGIDVPWIHADLWWHRCNAGLRYQWQSML